MYKKNSQGWIKHIDFILLDVIVLQAAFVLAYVIRHGKGNYPYDIEAYRSLGVVFAVEGAQPEEHRREHSARCIHLCNRRVGIGQELSGQRDSLQVACA